MVGKQLLDRDLIRYILQEFPDEVTRGELYRRCNDLYLVTNDQLERVLNQMGYYAILRSDGDHDLVAGIAGKRLYEASLKNVPRQSKQKFSEGVDHIYYVNDVKSVRQIISFLRKIAPWETHMSLCVYGSAQDIKRVLIAEYLCKVTVLECGCGLIYDVYIPPNNLN